MYRLLKGGYVATSSNKTNQVILELVHQYVAKLAENSGIGEFQKSTLRFQEQQDIGLLGWMQTLDWMTIAEKILEDTQSVSISKPVWKLKEMIEGKHDDEEILFTKKMKWKRYATYPKAPLNDLTKKFGKYKLYDTIVEEEE